MSKVIGTTTIIALAFFMAFGLMIAPVQAATDTASSVENFDQGLTKGGNAVDGSRSDANDALGVPDNNFVSLGYEGELILGFSQLMQGSLALTVHETTNGNYPLEEADVYVSDDANGPWISVGTADNAGDGVTTLDDINECFQFVRIVDATNGDLHNNNSDGFDVDALEADYDEVCEPKEEKPADNDDRISNRNSAHVLNIVHSGANTGGNYAGGADAGNGGNGGDIENDGDEDIEDSHTGNGGNGGDAGAGSGGLVTTGNAVSGASAVTIANSNMTRINRCACGGDEDGDTKVRNRNRAKVLNFVGADANTGDNAATGADAGNGGNAGDIDNDDDGEDIEESSTGNGGHGGDTWGSGGTVYTGHANSDARSFNLLNRNVTRVLR